MNRAASQRRAAELIRKQLAVTAGILRTDIAHLRSEGWPTDRILAFHAGEEDIHFMALLDADLTILGWRSRYEGYLPLSLAERPSAGEWVIDSPVGRILNVFVPLPPNPPASGYLYLGYSLAGLDELTRRSDRNLLLLVAVFGAAGLVLYRGLARLQAGYVEKTREAEAEKQEKERYREISAFTSGVAHEIKNPLNSLSLLCDLMARRAPEELREDAALGKTEVGRIAETIDRFSGALKPLLLRPESFDLAEAAEDAAGEVRRNGPGTDAAAVPIRVRLPRGLPIMGDRGLITQALANLLRNALEATGRGEVAIEGRRDRRRVVVRIIDTGPGIPEAELNRVFDPFFSTKERGMGIGLYLVRRIVEAHGGRVEAGNRPEGGAAFTLELPGPADHARHVPE